MKAEIEQMSEDRSIRVYDLTFLPEVEQESDYVSLIMNKVVPSFKAFYKHILRNARMNGLQVWWQCHCIFTRENNDGDQETIVFPLRLKNQHLF